MLHSLPDEDTLYEALIKKDKDYEGLFIVGVKTTGIFCRPTCTARKPKQKNVEFFKSTHEALMHGYRPCRKCRPINQEEFERIKDSTRYNSLDEFYNSS